MVRCLSTILATLLICGSSATAGDWPQILGPTRNGIAAGEKLLDRWPAGGPTLVWKTPVGHGYAGVAVATTKGWPGLERTREAPDKETRKSAARRESPVRAAANEAPSPEHRILILFDRHDDFEVLTALNAATGDKLWSKRSPVRYTSSIAPDDGPRCVPLINNDKVYSLGVAGTLSAHKLADGELLWRRELLKDFDVPPSYFGVGSTPVLFDDKLLVNVGGKNGAGIVAFKISDGATAWKSTDESASYSSPIILPSPSMGARAVPPSPSTGEGGERSEPGEGAALRTLSLDGRGQGEGALAIFITRLHCVALDPATGKEQWRFAFGSRGPTVNAATPLVIDNHLFVTSSYGVGAVWAKLTPPTAAQQPPPPTAAQQPPPSQAPPGTKLQRGSASSGNSGSASSGNSGSASSGNSGSASSGNSGSASSGNSGSASSGNNGSASSASAWSITELWRSDDLISSQYTTCVHRDGALFGIHGRQDQPPAHLRSIDPHTKKVLWSEDNFGTGNLILAGDKLLILKTDGHLILAAADKSRYRQLARASVLSGTAQPLPALAGGLLYIRDENELKCLRVGE